MTIKCIPRKSADEFRSSERHSNNSSNKGGSTSKISTSKMRPATRSLTNRKANQASANIAPKDGSYRPPVLVNIANLDCSNASTVVSNASSPVSSPCTPLPVTTTFHMGNEMTGNWKQDFTIPELKNVPVRHHSKAKNPTQAGAGANNDHDSAPVFQGTNNKRSYARGQGNVRFDFAPEDPYMGGSGGGSQSPRFSTPIGSDVKPLLLDLDKVLHHQACFETHTGLEERREALKYLNVLVVQWIQSESLRAGWHWQEIGKIGGRIVTYGSYMLGISHQGADIDALCIAPQHITRAEYFKSFYNLLSIQEGITELRAIERAFVPVIKFRFNGIEIDMTFTRLNKPEVPPQDSAFDALLQSNAMDGMMEPECIRSFNGYRSTIELLKLVPNTEIFRMALRAVKLWAKAQGLYSNVLGYLGGFSWAVLVAKACIDMHQSNPSGGFDATNVIQSFFHLFATWPWPQAVALVEIDPTEKFQQQQLVQLASSLNLLSWNPDKYPGDSMHVMPVLTTTYPLINSTFNVSQHTLRLIQEKMSDAALTCDQILNENKPWQELFKTCHIFHEYEHFLIVIASAVNHIQWFGLIESKLRYFISSVEKEPSLESARIWPKPLTRRAEKTNSMTQFWFIGLNYCSNDAINIVGHLKYFQEVLSYQSETFATQDMNIEAHIVQKSDLKRHLTDKEIGEILSAQSQKRDRDSTWFHGRNNGNGNRDSRSDSSSSNGSVTYAGITKSNSFNGGSRGPKLTRSEPQLPPPYLPSVPNLANVQPPHGNHHRNFFGSPTSNTPSHYGRQYHHGYHHQNGGIYKTASTSAADTTWILANPSPASVASAKKPTKSASMRGMMSSSQKLPNSTQYQHPVVSAASTASITTSPSYIRGPNISHMVKSVSLPASSSGDLGYNDFDYTDSPLFDQSYSSMESDNARSVSYSSDKFPPPSLVQARLTHTDKIPHSPFMMTNSGPQFDLPPPSQASSHGRHHHHHGGHYHQLQQQPPRSPSSATLPITTSSDSGIMAHRGGGKGVNLKLGIATSHANRLSSSEIRDMSTPLPVHQQKHKPLKFTFTSIPQPANVTSTNHFEMGPNEVFT